MARAVSPSMISLYEWRGRRAVGSNIKARELGRKRFDDGSSVGH